MNVVGISSVEREKLETSLFRKLEIEQIHCGTTGRFVVINLDEGTESAIHYMLRWETS